MNQPARPLWHPDEDAQLDNMWYRTDMFVADISDVMHRTPTSLVRRARRRNLGPRPPILKSKVELAWTDDEVAKLTRLAGEGVMRGRIAEILKRRVESVISKAKQENIKINDRHYNWSEDEMAHLRRLVTVDRLPSPAIFSILFPRTPHAIMDKIVRLGLSNVRKGQVEPQVEGAVIAPEPVETGPEPLWKAPPYVAWPRPVFGSAPTCQFPLWGHTAPPRPAPFCEKKSFRDSFCDEHWLRCHTPRTDREAAE